MANIANYENTLGAGVAQTWNFKRELGVTASSLVYSNDDASSTHTLTLAGDTFTVKPSEQRVFSGVQNWDVLVIGGDAGSTGAFRVCATSNGDPPIFYKPYGGPITTAALADGAVTDAKLAVGAHLPVTTGAAGSPYPIEVLVIDVANAAGDIDYTGLVGKHELLYAFATFTGATVAATEIDIKTSAGDLVCSIVAGAVVASGLTKATASVDTSKSTFASGATVRVTRIPSTGSCAARLTLVFMKVA